MRKAPLSQQSDAKVGADFRRTSSLASGQQMRVLCSSQTHTIRYEMSQIQFFHICLSQVNEMYEGRLENLVTNLKCWLTVCKIGKPIPAGKARGSEGRTSRTTCGSQLQGFLEKRDRPGHKLPLKARLHMRFLMRFLVRFRVQNAPYPTLHEYFFREASRELERKLSHIIWRHPSFQFLLTWRYFVAELRDYKPVRGRLWHVLFANSHRNRMKNRTCKRALTNASRFPLGCLNSSISSGLALRVPLPLK